MRIIGWCLAVVAFVGGIYFGMFRPSAGQKELQQHLNALDSVRSWRMDLQMSRNGLVFASRSHEATCPDMEHIYEDGLNGTAEFIRMSNLVFYKKSTNSWVENSNVPGDLFMPFPTPRPCMSNPGGSVTSPDSGDTEWRTEIQRAIKKGTIQEGELETVKGSSCRNYQVSWLNGRGQMMAYTICINEQDHLPRKIQDFHQSATMYFEWNLPVDIKAPALTPPETAFQSVQ